MFGAYLAIALDEQGSRDMSMVALGRRRHNPIIVFGVMVWIPRSAPKGLVWRRKGVDWTSGCNVSHNRASAGTNNHGAELGVHACNVSTKRSGNRILDQ